MPDFIGIIRDKADRGVRADRVDAWEPKPQGKTRVSLSGGGVVWLDIPAHEFTKRLDQALTAMREAQ